MMMTMAKIDCYSIIGNAESALIVIGSRDGRHFKHMG